MVFGLCPLFANLAFWLIPGKSVRLSYASGIFQTWAPLLHVLLFRKWENMRTLSIIILASSPWIQTPLDAWHSSFIYLLPSHPAALLSAGSQALLPGHACCWAMPLHMLHTQVLACSRPTFPLPEFAQMFKCCPFVHLYNADGCKICFAV